MADDYPLFMYTPAPAVNGPFNIGLSLLGPNGISTANYEGLWMPLTFANSGANIEVAGSFSALSLQLYGTNQQSPLNQTQLTVGGTVAAGHVVTLNFSNPTVGDTYTLSFTTVDTSATTTAAGLAAVINASSSLGGIGLQATSAGAVISLTWPSFSPSIADQLRHPDRGPKANTLVVTGSSTGSETVTSAVGTNGTAIGSAVTAKGIQTISPPTTAWIKARVTTLTGGSVSANVQATS